jgi:glyoxylase-like metal-dependent hydrolase (beta-lactamase superfamily II)
VLRALHVLPLSHPQGCRSYLVYDPESRDALALDVHLDLAAATAERLKAEGWRLRYVVDTHTHADHPSGAARLAGWFSAARVAHPKAGHAGVSLPARDDEVLALGRGGVKVRHAPGHTPDHLVLLADGAIFSGDSLFIGGVARTDFLGGDAGELFDTLQRVTGPLADATVLFPGHDYRERTQSTLGEQRAQNPWLQLKDRAEFVRRLTANPPPRPANMDDLLRLNREGQEIPPRTSAREAVRRVEAGAAGSVIDVRTDEEVAAESVAGSRHVPMHLLEERADEIRKAPAPRLLLCHTGRRAARAQQFLAALGVQALTVVEGGIEAYRSEGGATVAGASGGAVPDAGGCCAAPPPLPPKGSCEA